MKFRVGVTDNEWFEFLSKRSPDEVNFWQPGGKLFRALKAGEPFLFKLKRPFNHIAGGGFFIRHSRIPISLAWDAFGEKNGAANFEDFLSKINSLRNSRLYDPCPTIGCIILGSPFFFSKDDWIPVPEDWHPNIVAGKNYDTGSDKGARLWSQVRERLSKYKLIPEADREAVNIVAEESAPYGAEYLTRTRLGQGAFRILVTEAYNRRCAITGERTLPVLEAAHIKPHSKTGPNRVSNGLLLRSDMHKLFDIGYLTITRNFNIEVSKRIKEEYENGREYYAFHGKKIKTIPYRAEERPSVELIEWHNQNIYIS